MKKLTRQQTKTHNTRLVLKTLYDQQQLSRADLSRRTRLTRPTVSSLVSDLMADDLVLEVGTAPSGGGKPPTLLAINYDGHHLLALDLGSTVLRGALVNLRGDILVRRERPLTIAATTTTGDAALHLVYDLVDDLLAAATAPLLGIAVGTPGLIDPQDGVVRQAVNLGWENLPLRALLAARTDLPVYVANDSQAAALGEFTFGSGGSDSQNMIVVKVGQGIGAGIVLNGQPFYGDGFAAGEIGHVVVAENGTLCRCGNTGCLETIASTRVILGNAALLLKQDAVAWAEIGTALAAGNTAVSDMITRVGKYLGVAIANLIAAYNIHHIVFAGRIDQFGDTLLAAARAEAARRALPTMVADTDIRFSQLGADSVLLGSAAMVLKHELGVV